MGKFLFLRFGRDKSTSSLEINVYCVECTSKRRYRKGKVIALRATLVNVYVYIFARNFLKSTVNINRAC